MLNRNKTKRIELAEEKERIRRKTITMKSSFDSIGERTDVRLEKKTQTESEEERGKKNVMAKGE